MAIAEPPIYREVYYFLASSPTREAILGYRPSDSAQIRVRELLQKNKDGQLTLDEQSELDEFEQLEHFVRMLKLHTRRLMSEK